ncbi:CDK-activating kinase assembly factor MAT1 [Carpediemonas membranifera]|uniref:CDK-activating kinase assembly factor MAT1 n=1 Tax=Carpediemonas membranifera TaxID=201153 RepID=A0A8J6C091_9EUKA|nr:CDK-activating kinase assembly factor MAT1 [Carpediemonas membranifera]|eukprot:KAG9396336.1 CDK-activating kinase assembly factor MAT1 [Carpediemonas membranifera]
MKLLISKCGHIRVCDDCKQKAGGSGQFCDACNDYKTYTTFVYQQYEDPELERDENFRKIIEKALLLDETFFETIDDYDDFLASREEIILNSQRSSKYDYRQKIDMLIQILAGGPGSETKDVKNAIESNQRKNEDLKSAISNRRPETLTAQARGEAKPIIEKRGRHIEMTSRPMQTLHVSNPAMRAVTLQYSKPKVKAVVEPEKNEPVVRKMPVTEPGVKREPESESELEVGDMAELDDMM